MFLLVSSSHLIIFASNLQFSKREIEPSNCCSTLLYTCRNSDYLLNWHIFSKPHNASGETCNLVNMLFMFIKHMPQQSKIPTGL